VPGSGVPEQPDEDPGRPSVLERAGDVAAGIGSLGSGNPRRKAIIQYGIAFLIFAFLVGFLVRQWNQLPDFDWRFAPGWLVLAAPCVLLFYSLNAELWKVIVHWMGHEIPRRPERAIYGKSLLARYVPTNVLMVVGRAVMAEKYDVPKRVTVASIVYELALALGTAVMVGAYFVIELPDLEGQPARYAVLLVIPVILTLVHPRVFGPVSTWALRKLGREPIASGALSFRRVLLLCVGYIGTWVLVGLATYGFAASIHPVDISDLPYIAASYPVAFSVAVITVVAPSGIGTRDAALAAALSAVLPGAVATAIAVGSRLFQTALELSWIGFGVVVDRWSSRQSESG
jgi:hypothetical protein